MKTKSSTHEEMAIEQFKPVQPVFTKKELSNYFPKDELFTKKKFYFVKEKSGQQSFVCDWLNLNVGGAKIVLFKGVALSNTQLMQFDAAAKKYFLRSKGRSASIEKAKIEGDVITNTED